LFFLICCQDDRLHLHTLARLCLIAQKTDIIDQLHQCRDAESMHIALLKAEEDVLGKEIRTNEPGNGNLTT
jgi:mannitol/fructose-specific phosphotransferase system IIA component (Ntr-type)